MPTENEAVTEDVTVTVEPEALVVIVMAEDESRLSVTVGNARRIDVLGAVASRTMESSEEKTGAVVSAVLLITWTMRVAWTALFPDASRQEYVMV